MGDCDFFIGLKSVKPQGARKKDYGVIMCAETDPDMIVPLLWGAVFTDQDRRTMRRSEGGRRVELSVWHTSRASGLEKLRQRKPWILRHVHPALHPFVDSYEQALATCKYPYLQLDMDTLAAWLDYDATAVANRIQACLDAFDSEEGWQAYFNQPLVTNTYDLYGMLFMFSDFSSEAGAPGWYQVGPDGRIVPAGCPGGVFVLGESSGEEAAPSLPLFFNVCSKGDLAAVKSLLGSGQDVNARVELPRAKGVTGLMLAAVEGRASIVEELIRSGADVNAKSDKGATALMLASEDGHADCVKLLIDSGADVDAKNEDGWDALIMATIYKHHEIQKMLIEAEEEQ